MPRAPKPPTPAETLQGHYATVAGLIGSGAGEVEINAALTAAEGAGLNRTALRQAVHEGRLADKERRAEVACRLDQYRHLLDPPPPVAGLDPTPPTMGRDVRSRGDRRR